MAINPLQAQLLGDRVLLEVPTEKVDEPEVLKSGIVLPGDAKTIRPDGVKKAKVVSIGSKVTQVVVGETVLYSHWSPSEVQLGDDDKTYLVVNINDIIAKLTDEKETIPETP